MAAVISGEVRRLDGAAETQAYIVAALATPSGAQMSVLAAGPVSKAANLEGQITLPLEIKAPAEVHLRLAIPGRTLRETTVTLKPGVVYSLENVFSGEETPVPSPSPTPGVEISGDGDTAIVTGVVSGDGDTIEIGG